MKTTITKRTTKREVTTLDMFELLRLLNQRYELAQKLIAAENSGKATTKLDIKLCAVNDRIKKIVGVPSTVKANYMDFCYD